MSTYTPIASQTVGTATPSVTFSSLPQNYTDLIVVSNYGISANLYGLRIRFNDDTGSNYSDTVLYGDGSSDASFRDTSATSIITSAVGVSNNVLNYNFICNVQNYSNNATNKTVLVRANATNRETVACVGLWRNTNPITSVTIFVGSGDILAGTTFTIYGVSAGNSSAKASGGNIVTTDGSYWYHTFTSSGVFIPSQALTCDYLVVAGGGGGGYEYGGGGGGGGYRTSIGGSALSLSANTVYQSLIGAGGIGGGIGANPGYSINSTSGMNSSFSTISATGGGRGGSRTINNNASTGGSGGGGASGTGTGAAGNAGSYSPVEGFAGANANGGNEGGGGGGASAASVLGTRIGGNGATNSISGISLTYAGGGGAGITSGSGGAGGTGGGGAGGGGNNVSGINGTVNLGGGGGGAGEWAGGTMQGGNGGSGVVIIRYAV
jgi:hypothetical protein